MSNPLPGKDSPSGFGSVITSSDDLRAVIGPALPRAVRKQIDRLDHHCRAWIARSPFVLVATANRAGRCDVSPRGDAPGFVTVLDDGRLAIPERPGNRRLDSLENLLQNPEVGLLFIIPGIEETLRVNGHACITQDPELLAGMAVNGRQPALAIGVQVHEVYLHCAKALIRSRLWQSDQWPDLAGLPSAGTIFRDHANLTDQTVAEVTASLKRDYETRLY